MCLLANPEEKRENHMGTWQWIKACAKQNAGAQAQLKADVAKAYCGRKSCEGCKRCMVERTTAFRQCLLSFWRARLEVPEASTLSDRNPTTRHRAVRVVHVILCCGCVSSCGVERDFASMRARVLDLRLSVSIQTISDELWIVKNGRRPAQAKQALGFHEEVATGMEAGRSTGQNVRSLRLVLKMKKMKKKQLKRI